MVAAPRRYLLDTHALIWWWLEDPKLSKAARDILASPELETMVSAVSGFEIAQKVRTGKLPAMAEPLVRYGDNISDDGFMRLAINDDHAVRAGLLPGEHRDPFDRLIAAQALIVGATVVSRDPAFEAFGCKVLW